MPVELGLSSSQQDSFEQHEELSKLLNETDVFYVPLRTEFGDNPLNTNQDLTKRFDEDLSNKHLIVTFRDIGYSLFLDSVKSIPDANDQSKIRVSGKMIVDGICVQFFGCFDHDNVTVKHSDTSQKQINGIGRVQLDEEYYRELSSIQNLAETSVKEEATPVEPVIGRKTRQHKAKLKEPTETKPSIDKPKTRSRTTNESLSSKYRKSVSTSPPPPLPINKPLSHSSISTVRQRIHSPGHMPYPLRSPRVKQRPTSSPLQLDSSSKSKTPEVHSSLLTTASTTFNEYAQTNSTPTRSPSMETSQPQPVQILPQRPHFSTSTADPQTIPIRIPSSSNNGFPTASLPQLTNLYPFNQSHSLPTYFLPTSNIAYISAPSSTTNPSGVPFDLAALTGNGSFLLITSSNQHPGQPVQIFAPIDHRSLQFAHFSPGNVFGPPSVPLLVPPSRTCNILQQTTFTEPISTLPIKRHDNEEDKVNQQQIHTNKQSTEQLPFKKRRYTGQHSRMSTVRNDDGELSDESVKK